MNDLQRMLTSVTGQIYANALLRSGLLGLSAYLTTAALAGASGWPVLAGLLGFLAGVLITHLYQNKKPQAIRLIHQTIGDAEYSLALLDKPDLNIAEQLQVDRLNERVKRQPVSGVVLAQTSGYGVAVLMATAIYAGYPMLRQTDIPTGKSTLAAQKKTLRKPATPPIFQSAELRTQPPAYTGLPETVTADLNKSAVVGSVLTWRLRFSDTRQLSVKLVSSRGQALNFRLSGGVFTYQDTLLNSGLYAINAYWHTGKRDSLIYQSDFYQLEAKPDLPPKIEPGEASPGEASPGAKQLYRFHSLNDPNILAVTAKISDDFRVARAFIVATVARGSGENVKFREIKIAIGQSNFTEAKLTKTLDLSALNFSPGDELFYYWAAFDNCRPTPNFTKSDTYFLVFKDTTNQDDGELATMAVDLMPAYFRSQRQIIIDTEKLLAQKKTIPVKSFNSASNEIGYDQKALRLRYGQFLGEEFEKSIGGGGEPPIPTNKDGVVVAGMAVIQAYMHKHDTGEGNTGASAPPPVTHSADDGHNHGGGGAVPDQNKDPLAALMEQYVHSHDNAETNTFFEQSTRSLLKTALENMWQSELHLRLYEPEQALPFAHKALEFLKLSQQKARSFVKKSGFDPPPIKEKETRLTGDLTQVNAAVSQQRSYDPSARIGPVVAEVLGYIDLPQLTTRQRSSVQKLGRLLADRLLKEGRVNWSVLTGLQKLAGGKSLSGSEKTQLKNRLYPLTEPIKRTAPSYVSNRTLERAFWKHLK